MYPLCITMYKQWLLFKNSFYQSLDYVMIIIQIKILKESFQKFQKIEIVTVCMRSQTTDLLFTKVRFKPKADYQ